MVTSSPSRSTSSARLTGSPMTSSSSSAALNRRRCTSRLTTGIRMINPGMQRLRRVELAEIARVVGDEDEIAVARVAHDIPVFPARAADMSHVLGFMAGYPGNGDQVDAEAFVDQNLTIPR